MVHYDSIWNVDNGTRESGLIGVFSNNYINFKLWQNNLFVQLNLVKNVPTKTLLAGKLGSTGPPEPW